MTRREAQEILLSCRPGGEPLDDPQVAAALELTRTDPELHEWYEQHRGWDAAVRKAFQSLPVPGDLKYAILAGPKVVRGPTHWWRRPAALVAAAAMIALLVTLSVMLFNRPAATDTFASVRARMIGTAVREYRMDIETNDMRQVRAFLGQRGAPANYAVPAGLEKLKLAGAAVLNWEGKPVSMVCFERDANNLIWLFVLKAADFKDRPIGTPTFERVVSCATASWWQGEMIYVLAGETNETTLRELL